MKDLSYDLIRHRLEQVEVPGEPEALAVEWLIPETLAVGKTLQLEHGVILAGPQLSPSRPALIRALRFGTWRMNSGETVNGNRLDLPAGEGYSMATATIAAELIRQGVGERSLVETFASVEDFIERLLGQLSFSVHALAGLLGELLFLKQIVQRPNFCEGLTEPTSVWHGPKHDARDFRYQRMSVEVKTSVTGRRCHTIHSLDQIEPRLDGEGRSTEGVFLLSLGLQQNPSQGALSIPDIVESILQELERAPNSHSAKEVFLGQLARWGSPGSPRYDHASSGSDDLLKTRYSIALEPRLYRLADRALRLIRTEDLTDTLVNRQGLVYRAEFPDSVPGRPNNPSKGWPSAVGALLGSD